jgi:hypothetical protein
VVAPVFWVVVATCGVWAHADPVSCYPLHTASTALPTCCYLSTQEEGGPPERSSDCSSIATGAPPSACSAAPPRCAASIFVCCVLRAIGRTHAQSASQLRGMGKR